MNSISIAAILELPVQERIRLVGLIWESVAAVPEAVEISPALKAELEVRLTCMAMMPPLMMKPAMPVSLSSILSRKRARRQTNRYASFTLNEFEANPEAGYSWDQVNRTLKMAHGVPPETSHVSVA